MTRSAQQILPFPHDPVYAGQVFLAADSNQEALTWLERTALWPDHRLAIWGDPGCGKTHLTHIWAERTGSWRMARLLVEGLTDWAGTNGIAVDDADQVTDEPALLHLLNMAREAGRPVLLTGTTPPARWRIGLPDLASRLRAMTAVQIRPPEDSLLRGLFLRLLSDRQIAAPPAVLDWLLLRLPRSASAIREAAARLDAANLAAGGRITRSLAAKVLQELTGSESSLP